MNKVLIGKVVSDRMNKTIIVEIIRQEQHPRYEKIIKRTTRLFAHDEDEKCGVGDIVKIQEHRVMAKNKAWVLLEIIQKAK